MGRDSKERGHCVQRTNIQNLKAIHNGSGFDTDDMELCSKNEYTKSESNSQLFSHSWYFHGYCVQRTNIQNLKAIHNICPDLDNELNIVFKERIYKI